MKITNILDYFLKLIFNDIKEELKKYQKANNNYQFEKQIITELNDYFEKEPLNSKISKEALKNSIRLFISLVLFREEDKENKIKNNHKNIINYLNVPDLWDKKSYNDDKFVENLNKLKAIKIQVNQILSLYNYLTDNEEENFCEEIEDYILNESDINKEQKESEQDIEINQNEINNNNSENNDNSDDDNNIFDPVDD